MKVRALRGFWHGSKVIEPGLVIELSDADAMTVISSRQAEAVDPDEFFKAVERERERAAAFDINARRAAAWYR